ncbi:MAG TPA: aromatic ring-hydroxylating dioxygenase subunit alpha [Steroidobacteraceae bacterium]
MFLRNAWYVAALDAELVDRLLAVKILDERLVLYRRTNGEPAALEDACVHRKLPLSLGRIKGDHVECGYHGMTYGADGKCVRIPCAERIPKEARVRSYPIVSRYGLLWVWMGHQASADPATIFPVEHWGDAEWGVTRGDAMTVHCNYLYMTDNLLDPSHVAWVHPDSFGNAACESTPVEVHARAGGVIASRWMRAVEVAPLYVPFVRFEGLCDRLQHYEVRFPSHALVKAVFVPAGAGDARAERHERAFVMDSYNFLTPIDAETTRYYWFQLRNVSPENAEATRLLSESVRGAFEEDRVILNAVQQSFRESHTPHIDIAIDSAPLRFRRRLRQLITAEQPEQARDPT